MKQASNASCNYEKKRLKLGLEGKNFRRELLALTSELPSFIATIIESIHSLQSVIDYYGGFKIYVSKYFSIFLSKLNI